MHFVTDNKCNSTIIFSVIHALFWSVIHALFGSVSGVPGLIDVDVIYETRKRAQIALETVLADAAYSDREVSLREKIVYALESINKINRQEIREAFFELLLKETSVEFILKSLLLEQVWVRRDISYMLEHFGVATGAKNIIYISPLSLHNVCYQNESYSGAYFGFPTLSEN